MTNLEKEIGKVYDGITSGIINKEVFIHMTLYSLPRISEYVDHLVDSGFVDIKTSRVDVLEREDI